MRTAGLAVSLYAILVSLGPLASPAFAAPAVPVTPAIAQAGTGTATEYRHGAGIRAMAGGAVLISPLRIVLRTSPALPMPGDRATISLTVSNAGAAPLTGVKPILTVVSGSVFAGPPAGPVPAAGASINPNGGLTFTWTMTIGGTGAISVRAVVTATVTGQGAVSASADRDLAPPGLPRFSATLAPNPVDITAGRWFDVVVTVSNTGGVRAMQVSPQVSPSANAAIVLFKSGPVPAKPLSLDPGESAEFSFTYSANGSGTVSFTATVSGQADLTPPGLASRVAVTAAEKRRALAEWLAVKRAGVTAWMDSTIINPPKPPPPTEKTVLGFEREKDIAWETGGFADLALSSTRVTEGEHSCMVTFSVPGDFTRTRAGGIFRPSIRLVWPPRGTRTPLSPHDWTPFMSFRFDCYNPSSAPLELSFTLMDLRGYRYDELRVLAPASATRLEYGFASIREAGVDLARLASLELSTDTTAKSARPAIWLDNLRFELPPPPPPKRPRKAAVSATTMASSTVMTGSGRASTGTPTSAGSPQSAR